LGRKRAAARRLSRVNKLDLLDPGRRQRCNRRRPRLPRPGHSREVPDTPRVAPPEEDPDDDEDAHADGSSSRATSVSSILGGPDPPMAGPTLQREASVRALCNGHFTSHEHSFSIGSTMARAAMRGEQRPAMASPPPPPRRWHAGCAFGVRSHRSSLHGECALPQRTFGENPSYRTGPARSPCRYDTCTFHCRAGSPRDSRSAIRTAMQPPPSRAWVSAEHISSEQLRSLKNS